MKQTQTKPSIRAEDVVFKTHKVFTSELEIYLKESNAFGNVYFSEFFNFQGVMREKWWKHLAPDLAQRGYMVVTKYAGNKFLQSAYPFTIIIGELTVTKLTPVSLDLKICFKDPETGKYISEGTQKAAFLDIQTHQFKKLPEDILTKVREYVM